MNVFKFIAFSSLLIASFTYGIGIGLYKWFPFDYLVNFKGAILSEESTSFSTLVGYEVLKNGSIKEKIPCPSADNKLGVLVAFGQSNSANSGSYKVKNKEVPNVINYHNGNCYEASSPLLGATEEKGEWISLTAQTLVNNGLYDNVLVLSLGVAGSPVAAWSKGNELNKRLLDKLSEIKKVYEITDILWHQGEKDLSWGISLNQYRKSFSSMVSSLREIGVYAPIYISVASYCKEDCRFNCEKYPNNITKAQISLANELDGVVLGVNTDELITPNMRYDNCHFNEEGQRSAARVAAQIITSYHQ